jgi:hypothetical protein
MAHLLEVSSAHGRLRDAVLDDVLDDVDEVAVAILRDAHLPRCSILIAGIAPIEPRSMSGEPKPAYIGYRIRCELKPSYSSPEPRMFSKLRRSRLTGG